MCTRGTLIYPFVVYSLTKCIRIFDCACTLDNESDARTTYCQHSWFQCGIPMQGTLSKWTLLVQTVRYPDWWKLFWSANKRIVHIYINSIIQRLKYNLYSVDSDILYLTSTFLYSSLLLNLLAMHDSAAMRDQILRKAIWYLTDI